MKMHVLDNTLAEAFRNLFIQIEKLPSGPQQTDLCDKLQKLRDQTQHYVDMEATAQSIQPGTFEKSAPPPTKPHLVKFTYKNHKGQVEPRAIELTSIDYCPVPNNEMGYSPGWALSGLDWSRGREGKVRRTFLLSHVQLPEDMFRHPSNALPYMIELV